MRKRRCYGQSITAPLCCSFLFILYPYSSLGPSTGCSSFRINLLLPGFYGMQFLQKTCTCSSPVFFLGCSVDICSTMVSPEPAGGYLLGRLVYLLYLLCSDLLLIGLSLTHFFPHYSLPAQCFAVFKILFPQGAITLAAGLSCALWWVFSTIWNMCLCLAWGSPGFSSQRPPCSPPLPVSRHLHLIHMSRALKRAISQNGIAFFIKHIRQMCWYYLPLWLASFLLIASCFNPSCNQILPQELSCRLCIWSPFTALDTWIEIPLSISSWSTFNLSGVASGVWGMPGTTSFWVQSPLLPLHWKSVTRNLLIRQQLPLGTIHFFSRLGSADWNTNKLVCLFWLFRLPSITISHAVFEAAVLNWTPQGTFSFKLLRDHKGGKFVNTLWLACNLLLVVYTGGERMFWWHECSPGAP